MSDCIHCGTPFAPRKDAESFCCKGCEFVHELIHEEGLERFYALRKDVVVKPARSVPFESHDFRWLVERVGVLETNQLSGRRVEGDFSLDGVSCIGCVWLIEKIFLRLPGAVEAAANPSTGRLHLEWVAGEMDLSSFAKELASFGYTLGQDIGGQSRPETRVLGARHGLCGAFMLNAMGFTLPTYLGMPNDFVFAGLFQLITILTATLSMLVGATYFISRAWHAMRMGQLHIDLPIALGLIVAYLGSIAGWAMNVREMIYFDFVSTFVFLMLGGRYLQISVMEKNRLRLQRQRPLPSMMNSPDRIEPIELQDLAAGVRFHLEPGQASPVAAVVGSQAEEFSLEWINGESESQMFPVGRHLPAGAIYLGKDPVLLIASEKWLESALSNLVASERVAARVPAIEKLLKIYLSVVLCLGVSGLIWWTKRQGLVEGLQVMISLFVVSCPCALGVALPMADEISASLMERMGVFVRQPLLWARLSRVKTLIFDKTGTLTMERPVLVNQELLMKLDKNAKLALARLAAGSLHPVSRTLLESLGREGQVLLRKAASVSVQDFPGKGRLYVESDSEWSLGKPGWRSGVIASDPPIHDAELCRDGVPWGRFIFRESLRGDAIAALKVLKERGYRLVILSGDRPEKVAITAQLLGISAEDAHASLAPEEKEKLVQSLDQHDTLYLGDGANDSLAFNSAWVTGTPVVDRSILEGKSDFHFVSQGMGFLPRMLDVVRRRKRAVRMAFFFALTYNFSVVGICLQGLMSPLLAAVLMPLSSVVSLAIVSLVMRSSRADKGGVVSHQEFTYDGAGTLLPASIHHDPGFEPLRPRSV